MLASSTAPSKEAPTVVSALSDERLQTIAARLLNLPAGGCAKDVLSQDELSKLIQQCRAVVTKEKNLVEVDAPARIFGCLLGDFDGLKNAIVAASISPAKESLIFLGDYVDGGEFGIEILCLLMAWKVLHPKRVTLLRGAHELRQANEHQGFRHECQRKFVDSVWTEFNRLFAFLPLASLVGDQILAIRGFLPEGCQALDELNAIARPHEGPASGVIEEVIFNKPTNEEDFLWRRSRTGLGKEFGTVPPETFCSWLQLKAIIRGADVLDGYEVSSGGRVINVCSSHNLRNLMYNEETTIVVNKKLEISAETMRHPPPPLTVTTADPLAPNKDKDKAAAERSTVAEKLFYPMGANLPTVDEYEPKLVTLDANKATLRALGSTSSRRIRNGSGTSIVFYCVVPQAMTGAVTVEPLYGLIRHGESRDIIVTRTSSSPLAAGSMTVAFGKATDDTEPDIKMAVFASTLNSQLPLQISE